MTHHARSHRAIALTAALAATLLAGGCRLDPAAIPVPGTTAAGEKYRLHIQFADVLNLPQGAKVTVNGVLVGNLDSLDIVTPAADPTGPRDGYVLATVQISDSVRLPATTTAQLRQSTPLGDVHIALTTPSGGTATDLAPDATIPIGNTKPATQIEDTLAGLATTAGSGALTNVQDIVRQLNQVFTDNPAETARVFGVIGGDLIDVADRLHTLDALLDGLQANTTMIDADRDILDRLLTDYGVEHVTATVNSAVQLIFVFSDLGPVARSAAWLGPLVGSLDATATAYVPALFGSRPLDLSSPSNLRKLVDLIQTKIVPFVQHGPKVDIVSAEVSSVAVTPAEQTDQIIAMLRMIGAVR
ncbi:MlaD family protein [Nocardia sp. NPDC050175]|uniref:MlaD family protein n=1 Tax=Nocardia sp. NPDC050175 TaxID=3364317 RepID=UPI0037A34422